MSDARLFLHAMSEIRARLDELNGVEKACGLPPMQDQDKTFRERAEELTRRAILLETWSRDGQELATMDVVLDTVGAHLVAFKLAIAKAQETRVETGDAA